MTAEEQEKTQMNTETQNNNTGNKKLILIIIIAIAVIVLAVMALIVINAINKEKIDEANVTLFTCNTGKTLTEADIKEIEEIIRDIVGDKLMKIEKTPGVLPVAGFPTNQDGEEYVSDVGDGISAMFYLLELSEKEDITSAIAVKCGFIHLYGPDFEKTVYQISFVDKSRPDIK